MNKELKSLNKKEILDQYNLTDRNYYHRLKKGLNNYSEQQLNKLGHNKYLIDESIIDEVFTTHRKPNKNDVNKIKDYIMSSSFDYIGCIYPRRVNRKEIKEIIEIIFKELIKEHKPSYLTLFYAIENNNVQQAQYSDTHCHTHFLIQVDKKQGFIQKTMKILSSSSDSRPFLEKYNSRWEYEGKKYTIKDVSSSEDCSYLSYNRR